MTDAPKRLFLMNGTGNVSTVRPDPFSHVTYIPEALADELAAALEAALDSLVFAADELEAQAHIPYEDSEMIDERIEIARTAITKYRGET